MTLSIFFLIGAMFCNDRIAAGMGKMFSDAFKQKPDEKKWERNLKFWSTAKYVCWLLAAVWAIPF